MQKFELLPHFDEQRQVMYYGKRIAYASAGNPVCFLRLRPNEDVSDEVKTEAIEFVIAELGEVRWTKEMEKYRRDKPGRPADKGTQAGRDKG